MHAQGMTDSQRVTAPIIDHVHRVGVTTRRLTTPDASRSGKGGWKAPCVGFCYERLHTFGFRLEGSCGASGLAKPRKN